jgi:hypothetical protein
MSTSEKVSECPERSLIDVHIDSITSVIAGLAPRQSSSFGCDWVAIDAALRCLRGAVVALEEVAIRTSYE